MLPLWIIDLRGQSNRRDEFERLVGQIDHVAMPPSGHDADNTANPPTDEGVLQKGFIRASKESLRPQSIEGLNPTEKLSVHEQIEALDREEANRSSRIVGNYWKYCQMANKHYKIDIQSDEVYEEAARKANYDAKKMADLREQTAKTTAEKLYEFQSDLVKQGQDFIKELRKSNVQPDLKINIVVLGDITEDFTRIVFPSVATIIQKEKGRLLPHHIHQGMEVIGMLYVPSDINTLHVNTRRSMQRTLKEIDVQHQVPSIRGYDHMMLYQDVQNRTECSYSIMNDKQLAEYLLQCLVHLYLACNEAHPLLSGTASADVFYFSMGATSVHFDTDNEDAKAAYRLAMEFIRNLKSEGDDEKAGEQLSLVGNEDYSPFSFFGSQILSKLNVEIEDVAPSPHPVRQWLYKYLKRYYYNLYLRFFTKNMMQRIIMQIDTGTRNALETISADCKRRFIEAQSRLQESVGDIWGKLTANDGGLPAVIHLFKEMQGRFSRGKDDIRTVLEQKYWRLVEDTYLTKEIKDSFIDYHDAYVSDLKGRTGNTNQLDVKKQAVTHLNGLLSREATILGRFGRSLLLGIMCALAVVPLLNLISPEYVDLGPVRLFNEEWSFALFFVPAILQVISYFRFNRAKKKAVNNLKAMYLHDAYARVANRIESEVTSFYDRMIELGDKYILRCESIRKEVGCDCQDFRQARPLFPESMFNQPLVNGQFGGEGLLPEEEADDSEVRINYAHYKLHSLRKSDYFLLINQFKDLVAGLFRDVKLCENLIRRVNDDGEEELVTKDQQEAELEQKWIEHRNEFYERLFDMTREVILPRENATVGDKLRAYCMTERRNDVLKQMIAYAATNGEMTSSADKEFTDAKLNDKRIEEYIVPFVSTASQQMQIDKYNTVYRRYIFITRWRCFEHFSFNRILPTEDFDEKVHRQMVYEAEVSAKDKKKRQRPTSVDEALRQERSEGVYTPRTSSLLLWALCPDDSSSDWFRLFNSDFFVEAYSDKNIYRKELNKND